MKSQFDIRKEEQPHNFFYFRPTGKLSCAHKTKPNLLNDGGHPDFASLHIVVVLKQSKFFNI